MATITFGNITRSYLVQDVFTAFDGMKLMSGTVPSDFTGLTSAGSMNSNVLVEFTSLTKSTAGGSSYDFNLYTTGYSTALSSGTATWLWGYELDTDNSTILNQFIATVGTSGTDVILGNTAIISGAKYRLQDIRFEFPEDYTY